jgi:Protein of unknown function (DUF3575)
MLKGTGLLLSNSDLLDAGIEVKLGNHWTFELSASRVHKESNDFDLTKSFITPQVRYYFLKNKWKNSPYCGLIFQKHHENNLTGVFNSDKTPPLLIGQETQIFIKMGVGLIAGQHVQIYKWLGCDAHLGVLEEKGNVVTTQYIGKWKGVLETNKWNSRFFWGFNFYLAL